MYNNPWVSLEQVENMMEDFKTRFQRNGYSLRLYYDRLYEETQMLCQYDKAKEYLDLRNAVPDDAMRSCLACTLDNELDYYLMTGYFRKEASWQAKAFDTRNNSTVFIDRVASLIKS